MIAEPLIIIRDDVDLLVKLDALGLRIDFAVVEILLAEKSFCGLDERRFDTLFDSPFSFAIDSMMSVIFSINFP